MSRAFIKEDVDLPERSGKLRSASGLPPGALNYMTRRGATRLQAELSQQKRGRGDNERAAELERILASATIVEPSEPGSNSVAFGSTVTVETQDGETRSYHIVGVDELELEPDSVSWISPLGKALLAAELGQRIPVSGDKSATMKVVKIEPGLHD